MPGYNLKVHGEYARLASLQCSSCKLLLREAIQTEEGLRLCKSCLQNCSFEPEEIHADICVQREVDKLPVKCENYEDGCSWVGELKDHEQFHKHDCPYKTEACSKCENIWQLPAASIPLQYHRLYDLNSPVPKFQSHDGYYMYDAEMSSDYSESVAHYCSDQMSLDYHQAMLLQRQHQKSTLFDSILSEIERNKDELLRINAVVGCVPAVVEGKNHSRSLNDLVTSRMMLEEQRVKVERLESVVRSLEKIHADHVNELDLRLDLLRASTFNGSFLWRIPDIQRKRKDAVDGKTISLYSPPFYTGRNGYKMCIRAYLNGDGIGYNTHVSLFFALMKGEYDPLLKWPFDHKVALIMVDQNCKNNIVQCFKPLPDSSSFQKPKSEMNIASGFPKFVELKVLNDDSFVKDDVLYIMAVAIQPL